MYVIAVGNLFDGTVLYGPFDDVESAENWVVDNKVYDWELTEIQAI